MRPESTLYIVLVQGDHVMAGFRLMIDFYVYEIEIIPSLRMHEIRCNRIKVSVCDLISDYAIVTRTDREAVPAVWTFREDNAG